MNESKAVNNIIKDLISKNKIIGCKLFLKYETVQIETLDGIVINIKPADIFDLNLWKKISVIE